MMYRIHATVVTIDSKGWRSSRQVPIFFLDSEIQGILSIPHAEKIAGSIVLSGAIDDNTIAHVTAVGIE
jgi:hypothetical protein